MESTLLFSSTLSLSKSFISSTPLSQRLFSTACPGELVRFQLRRCEFSRVRSGPLVRGLGTVDPHWIRFQCAASSAPSFASGGGGSDGIDGNGGGGGGGGGGGEGDGAAEGGEGKSTAVAAGAEDDSALSSDVIVLHVGVSSNYYYYFQSHFIWRKWEEYFLYFLFKRPSQEIMKYPLIVKLLNFISLHVMV